MTSPLSKNSAALPPAATKDSGPKVRSGPDALELRCARSAQLLSERRTARVDFYGIDEGGHSRQSTMPCDLPDCCMTATRAPATVLGELRKLLAGLVFF
jgi:hypothetical protein